jgi:hypothetical protein
MSVQKKLSLGKVSLVVLIMLGATPASTRAGDQDKKMEILNLNPSSGKQYVVDHSNLKKVSKQYIDRDYMFNYIPEFLQGQTHIQTAGNDKHIDEDKPCLSFDVTVPVTVYILYGDILRLIPSWLKEYKDTKWKVTRNIESCNVSTLKGIFTLFTKDFQAGKITLNGNLSKKMAKDPEFKKMKGTKFCMYSVVVVPR